MSSSKTVSTGQENLYSVDETKKNKICDSAEKKLLCIAALITLYLLDDRYQCSALSEGNLINGSLSSFYDELRVPEAK